MWFSSLKASKKKKTNCWAVIFWWLWVGGNVFGFDLDMVRGWFNEFGTKWSSCEEIWVSDYLLVWFLSNLRQIDEHGT